MSGRSVVPTGYPSAMSPLSELERDTSHVSPPKKAKRFSSEMKAADEKPAGEVIFKRESH